MTELIYLDDSYIREIDAEVVKVQDNRIVLNRTIFYPRGGGQPNDTGYIDDARVIDVYKEGDEVIHVIDGKISRTHVHLKIDWDRRYRLMRMHTAAHVLAGGVMYSKYGAKITGNQLDVDVSRFDFNIESFDRDLLENAIQEANRIIQENRLVKVYYISREDALSRPELVKLYNRDFLERLSRVRIVEIEGVDVQADGGTHVRELREIGKIELVKMENKGKNNRRVYFTVNF
ncbi:MAG: alanyl-tRNA editing protein [Candidatus Micrarchaeota archaeon]|nr:alanyl-tRNA editing protein [Candidatus Micrarchaeota archaeon]MCX8154507.1 alanyl-tRNA editing protein [Candidatus Micrarchaeota archaeon]